MLVAGIDGCKGGGGWLIVVAEASDRLRLAAQPFIATFQEIISDRERYDGIAVDIPIGLSEGPERAADEQARQLLGEPRARSVFRAPCWPVLEETTNETEYRQVCDASRRHCLRKDGRPAAISQQAWRIMPKVREANLAMTPELQKVIVEVHPEVSFSVLNGGKPMTFKKKRAAGKAERIDVLSRVFAGDLSDVKLPPGAARDDLLDACAAAWTAARYARGEARTLPDDPPVDAHGLRMEIVY